MLMIHQIEQRYPAITLNVSSASKMFKNGLFHYLGKLKNLIFLLFENKEKRDVARSKVSGNEEESYDMKRRKKFNVSSGEKWNVSSWGQI
jgi:hypothetical protein